MPPARTPAIVRFWRHVEKTDGCWLWTGKANVSGYGVINLNTRTMFAHRFLWTETHGPIPDGLYLCHHCDTPRCVNPAHLFLGTQKDNMQDYARKGLWKPRERQPRGSTVKTSKLTESQVKEIRFKSIHGHSYATLAAEYGVTSVNIGYIVRGKAWRHVA
jgi:hypothetical protein